MRSRALITDSSQGAANQSEIGNVTFACEDPPRLAEFWATLLDGERVELPDSFDGELVRGPDGPNSDERRSSVVTRNAGIIMAPPSSPTTMSARERGREVTGR